MKNKKIQSFILISILMLANAFYSCKKDDEFTKFAKSEQRMKKRSNTIMKREMDIYYKHIFDSVYNDDLAQVQKKIGGKLPNETRPTYLDLADIQTFQNNAKLSGTMDNEILSAGQNILNKYYRQLASVFKKYNIDISGVHHYFIANNVQDLLFIGVGANLSDNKCQIGQIILDNIANDISEIINNSNCATEDRILLNQIVTQTLIEMPQSFITNRTLVEQKYSDYYLLNDAGQRSLGLTQYNSTQMGSYKMLDQFNCKYLITQRNIELNTNDVLIDFLSDPTATYKLISLAPAQWQIVKKLSNGEVITGNIFYDNGANVQTVQRVSDTPESIGNSQFVYTVSGNGVKINFVEIIDVIQRKKDWSSNLSDADRQKSDSLRSEIDRKNKMDAALNRAWVRADSVARRLTLEYFDGIEK